uniref:uncharacterized protein LOC120331266 n=1 Tax=Styela clava TaxID=7725 RepID=UPI00193A81E5|nr:uncharacterized protein LOC120331266 [Styela clava]
MTIPPTAKYFRTNHQNNVPLLEGPAQKYDTISIPDSPIILSDSETFYRIKVLLFAPSKTFGVYSRLKSNARTLVQISNTNTKNAENRRNGYRSEFSDDCGVWNSKKGTSPKTFYFVEEGCRPKKVFKKAGQFCNEKEIKGRRTYNPLIPQPSSEQLLEIQRYYASLKGTKMFKKRVTCILSSPTYLLKVKDEIALVEFVGSNQVKTIHLNAKTLEKISQELQQKKPREVYNDFLLQDKVLVQTPRNLCQLYSKKHNDKKTTIMVLSKI